MSQQNMEIVRRLFEAVRAGLARGDFGAGFDTGLLPDDFEWIPAPEIAGPKSYRGRDEYVEFMSTWTEDFDDWSIRLERLIDADDDRVVALAHQWATGKGSGVPVELHFGQLFELDEGRVVRVRNYLDPAAALEAAGLSE